MMMVVGIGQRMMMMVMMVVMVVVMMMVVGTGQGMMITEMQLVGGQWPHGQGMMIMKRRSWYPLHGI